MIRSKATRVLVFALAVLMTLTSIPFEAFAYVGGGDGDNNTSNGGAWGGNWLSSHQGVRVSIVDADGNNMMQGGHSAVDIVFAQPSADRLEMTGNKFEPMKNGKDTYIIPVGLLNVMLNDAIRGSNGLHKQKELKEYRTSSGKIDPIPSNYEGLPLPMIYPNGSNTLTGNGEAVKAFFEAIPKIV